LTLEIVVVFIFDTLGDFIFFVLVFVVLTLDTLGVFLSNMPNILNGLEVFIGLVLGYFVF
jgi:hypothetical protein